MARRAYLYHDNPTKYNYILGPGSFFRLMLRLCGLSYEEEHGFNRLIVNERGDNLKKFFTSVRMKELRGKGVRVKIR